MLKKLSELTPAHREINGIINYAGQHPNELRTIESYCAILGISNARSITTSLVRGHKSYGLLKVRKAADIKVLNFFGFSPDCESRACYYDWCKGYKPDDKKYACPLGEPNPGLKFIEL